MPVSQGATDIEVRLDATDIETDIETDIKERLANLRQLAKQLLNELDEDSTNRDADDAAAAAPVMPAEDSRDRDANGAAAAAPVKPSGWRSRLW